jgi:hypothetical protein
MFGIQMKASLVIRDHPRKPHKLGEDEENVTNASNQIALTSEKNTECYEF